MLVVKAWRHYYTCIVDIIALLLHRMLGWTHWSVFQRGIMSRHHFKDTELRMGHHKVIWSSLITVSRVSIDLLHQWTVIMVEWVCIRKSLYLTQEDLAGEVRQGIQMNKMWKTYYVFLSSPLIFLDCSVCTVLKKWNFLKYNAWSLKSPTRDVLEECLHIPEYFVLLTKSERFGAKSAHTAVHCICPTIKDLQRSPAQVL